MPRLADLPGLDYLRDGQLRRERNMSGCHNLSGRDNLHPIRGNLRAATHLSGECLMQWDTDVQQDNLNMCRFLDVSRFADLFRCADLRRTADVARRGDLPADAMSRLQLCGAAVPADNCL